MTDPRYTEQDSIEIPDYTIINWRALGHGVALQSVVAKEDLKGIGFEADQLVFEEYATFKEAVKADLVPTKHIIETFREIKPPQEIQYLRNACDFSCRALTRLLKEIKVGDTEKELGAKLALYMVEEGADLQPYGNIIILVPIRLYYMVFLHRNQLSTGIYY